MKLYLLLIAPVALAGCASVTVNGQDVRNAAGVTAAIALGVAVAEHLNEDDDDRGNPSRHTDPGPGPKCQTSN